MRGRSPEVCGVPPPPGWGGWWCSLSCGLVRAWDTRGRGGGFGARGWCRVVPSGSRSFLMLARTWPVKADRASDGAPEWCGVPPSSGVGGAGRMGCCGVPVWLCVLGACAGGGGCFGACVCWGFCFVFSPVFSFPADQELFGLCGGVSPMWHALECCWHETAYRYGFSILGLSFRQSLS